MRGAALEDASEGDLQVSLRRAYSGKLFPDELIGALRRGAEIFPTRRVSCGTGPARGLNRSVRQIDDLLFESQRRPLDLFDYVSRNRVTALLVLDDGEIALEHYGAGTTEATRWSSMSIAKSVLTTLAGAAIQDGTIASLDEPASAYVGELADGAYARVTIRDLLQMTSGIDWNETYEDPASDRRRMLELQFEQRPEAILRYVVGRPAIAAPGTRWNYSTGETHIVGAVVRTATGKSLAEYLSEKIWSRVGMESDAAWWLEAPGGAEIAGSGLNATLRDYGRLGLFVMNGGVIDGESVLPPGWVEEAGAPRRIGGEQIDFGYMWWPIAAPEGSQRRGGFRAGGIFGQYIYVNPAERVVVVVWSARSKPKGAEAIPDNDFFHAVVEHLR